MSTHGKTRLSCRIARLREAMTGSRAQHHVARCPACQAYYNAADNLVDRLRVTAPQNNRATPGDLAARIARSVREAAPPPAPARRRTRALETFAALAGAAAVFAFSFHLARQNITVPTNSTDLVTTANQPDLSALVAGVGSLADRLLASVEPATETIATENPLSMEFASVQADARKAVGFLALNFLPASSVSEIEDRLDPSSS